MGPMGRKGAHAEPTLVLRAGRDRSLRRRHPWIFAGAVADVAGAPEPGDVVAVRSATGELLARASFEPGSGILARVWAFGDPDGAVPAVDDELVTGAPRGGGARPRAARRPHGRGPLGPRRERPAARPGGRPLRARGRVPHDVRRRRRPPGPRRPLAGRPAGDRRRRRAHRPGGPAPSDRHPGAAGAGRGMGGWTGDHPRGGPPGRAPRQRPERTAGRSRSTSPPARRPASTWTSATAAGSSPPWPGDGGCWTCSATRAGSRWRPPGAAPRRSRRSTRRPRRWPWRRPTWPPTGCRRPGSSPRTSSPTCGPGGTPGRPTT